jgi:choline monooxygenase
VLPGEIYCDATMFAVQRERVFARSWQFVGDVLQLSAQALGARRSNAQSGAASFVCPFELLPGCLDEPLLLTVDTAGVVRCLSNVCTHRGNVLVERAGEAQGLRCGYHGRRFSLDGRCAGSPEFDGLVGFPSASDDLPQVATGRLGPLLFTSLDPQADFAAWSQPVARFLSFLPLDRVVLDPRASREYEVAANWALYCDNYLEGFHIPFVHPELAHTLDWKLYRTELTPWGTLQVGVAAPGEEAFALPEEHPHHGERIAAYWLWLFPNTMLNLYPWGLSVNIVHPLAVDRTRVLFFSYVFDTGKRGRGAGGDLHTVELQDERVVERVQRGVRARLYRGGEYCPTQEAGLHHFHRILTQAMAGA